MNDSQLGPFIIDQDDIILVTGASGFVGPALIESLVQLGCCNLRCFTRPTSDLTVLEHTLEHLRGRAQVEIIQGNLLSREDCVGAMKNVAVVFHLATGRDGKSYPDAFMNAVVTTRNLLEASLLDRHLQRFVSVSSLAVYSNVKHRGRILDEGCPVENQAELRGDAYSYAKVKQDQLVEEYGDQFGIPYVIVRPGYVLGPGKAAISSRVGIDTFGMFLHLGGSNKIPFTYIDNCAEAIALAGLKPGLEREVFNIVDDDLPSSRQFLRLYKKNVRKFYSLYIPHAVSYLLCSLWERYSNWSQGQLPLTFNRKHWHVYWKKTRYRNEKLKTRLGWVPRVSMTEALRSYFGACRDGVADA
jgi:nucleoside-diphosphate-sugar epimerase